MSLITKLPPNWPNAITPLNRFIQMVSASTGKGVGPSTRPNPPRSVVPQKGTQSASVTWVPPADATGIIGYRVYSPNDSTPHTTTDVKGYAAVVALAANAKQYASVCSFNAQGQESIKVPIVLQANTDQIVASGGASGSYPKPPPGWPY